MSPALPTPPAGMLDESLGDLAPIEEWLWIEAVEIMPYGGRSRIVIVSIRGQVRPPAPPWSDPANVRAALYQGAEAAIAAVEATGRRWAAHPEIVLHGDLTVGGELVAETCDVRLAVIGSAL